MEQFLDVYDGDMYKGVMWYCDDCGALLNKQNGFSDYYSSWSCTNCCHDNDINESEIRGSNEDVGLLATVAKGLIDGVVEGVSDALISRMNDNDESKYYDEEVVEECTNRTEDSDEINNKKVQIANLHKKRFISFLFKKKRISINYSSVELINKDINEVVTLLENVGFTNISTKPIKDIYVDSTDVVGAVSNVSILGVTTFSAEYMCKYSDKIVVSFHEKKTISIPFSYKEAKKMNYEDAFRVLVNQGFTNIKSTPFKNLILGIVNKKDIINNISVGSFNKFDDNQIFEYDTEINIYYNSFK